MVRLIQKSGFIKSGRAGGYMKYIGTRERVEKLEGSGPATENQQMLIDDLLRDFPETKQPGHGWSGKENMDCSATDPYH